MIPATHSLPAAGPNTDHVVDWLVRDLELKATVFHIGQYCGDWQASTAGKARASFHLVLRGHCYLHLANREPVALGPRDGVFLLRDLPHALSPERTPGATCTPRPLEPLQPVRADGTSLACGFFDFHGLPAELLGAFPDCLLLRAGSDTQRAAAPLFDLILAEAERDGSPPSPLIERLTGLLFFYLIRDLARSESVTAGIWTIAGLPRFAPLLARLLDEPGRDWSVDDMARLTHMSRARFFKHFVHACGQPPARFLLALRMSIAARRLRGGDSVTRAAEHVGYQSPAAFTRAFHKVIGEQPGAYQRARRSTATHGYDTALREAC